MQLILGIRAAGEPPVEPRLRAATNGASTDFMFGAMPHVQASSYSNFLFLGHNAILRYII